MQAAVQPRCCGQSFGVIDILHKQKQEEQQAYLATAAASEAAARQSEATSKTKVASTATTRSTTTTQQSCLATAVAAEAAAQLHADRTTHPSIVLVARPTVCRAGYYVRACGNAYVPC